MLPESEPRVRFAYIPVVPPFAGAGQNEAVVEGYMAALEALGAVRWDPDGAEAAGPVCYLVATGGTEAALLGHYAARQVDAPGEPAIIVAHPCNNSLPASLESLARLQQEGARGRIVYLTAPDDERGLAALASAVGDVAVRSALHSARIGLLGAPSDWLVASMPSADTVSAVWGPEVVPVDMAEVADALARVSAEEIAATAGALVTGATDVREPSEAEISDVARVYAALDAVVRAHDLDALTVRCFDLLLSDKTTGCFALSELTDRGIVAGCEGDLVSTIGLVWARLLTGEVPWMANPSHLDEQSNSLVLAHCTVPRTLLPEALAQVAAIAGRYGFEHGNVFHAGDGNLHPLILFDSRDAGQLERVHAAGWEIMSACVALGGTISGEHGIGLEKMEAMRLVFSDEEIEAQRSLQNAFDPDRILNPGKIFPDTSRPFASRDRAAWAGPPDPLTAAESLLAERVQQAYAAGQALRPAGSDSLRGFGNTAQSAWERIHTGELNAIFELDPSNQVLTVGAGMRLEAVQAALALRNQWLPLRPAFGGMRRSIGGITASNASGPERVAYGSPRRLLLGLRFIDGRGRRITAGGKVVKNVAGYDLTRLLAGSAGTLGLITRATLRTATRPERCVSISASGLPNACDDLAVKLLGSNLGAVSAAAVPEEDSERWRLEIGFEGFGATVASQLKRAEALFAQAGFGSIRVTDYDLLTGPFAGLCERIAGCPFALRAGVPPDRTGRAAELGHAGHDHRHDGARELRHQGHPGQLT